MLVCRFNWCLQAREKWTNGDDGRYRWEFWPFDESFGRRYHGVISAVDASLAACENLSTTFSWPPPDAMTKDEFVLATLAASDGAAHMPVQVQKLFFLIDRNIGNRINGPFFNFQPDSYGPFDVAVYRTLESLAGRGLVEIEEVLDLRRKVYRTTPSGRIAGGQLLSSLPHDISDYIRRLSGWVRGQSFAELVTAIYNEYPDMKAKSIFARR